MTKQRLLFLKEFQKLLKPRSPHSESRNRCYRDKEADQALVHILTSFQQLPSSVRKQEVTFTPKYRKNLIVP